MFVQLTVNLALNLGLFYLDLRQAILLLKVLWHCCLLVLQFPPFEKFARIAQSLFYPASFRPRIIRQFASLSLIITFVDYR